MVSGLTNQIKTLEGVQSVNMLQLISIMHPINRGGEGEGEGEVTVLVEDEYDDGKHLIASCVSIFTICYYY